MLSIVFAIQKENATLSAVQNVKLGGEQSLRLLAEQRHRHCAD